MSLRRILRRQPYINPLLCPPLPTPIRYRRPHTSSPHLPSRNRIKQPNRSSLRLRQNSIPPILHRKRHSRFRTNNRTTRLPSPILPKPPRRPRKLHASQPPSNSSPHQTRMILPIRLRHPTIHPKQTRRRTSPSRLNPRTIPYAPTPHIKTTINNFPSHLTNPILSPSCKRPHPYMSRKPTSRTPIHYHRPTSLTLILHNHSSPIPPSQPH
uniref:Uncharacterized protein n=1 Tax=Serinus canaria TaxID=9135 RepID=A0A8C9MDU0_SERCA